MFCRGGFTNELIANHCFFHLIQLAREGRAGPQLRVGGLARPSGPESAQSGALNKDT